MQQAREIVGPEVELYVDANGAYSAGQAVRVGRALADAEVTWFEEPVSSDDLAGLRQVRAGVLADVAAGDTATTCRTWLGCAPRARWTAGRST